MYPQTMLLHLEFCCFWGTGGKLLWDFRDVFGDLEETRIDRGNFLATLDTDCLWFRSDRRWNETIAITY
jgi:hypothetical protein